MKLYVPCLLGLAGLAAFSPAQVEYPANGHYYELISTPLDWNQARAAAQSRTYQGRHGHLVTVTSAGEQNFLIEFLGESMREKHMGGQLVGDQWTWITGEPFNYTNWAPGEPNGGQTGCMNFHGANALGTWNDVPTYQLLGYIVEYDSPLSYTLSKYESAGQNFVKGTVRLAVPSQFSTLITLSDDSSLVSEPPTVTIPAGAQEKSFQIQTLAVNSTIVTQLRAKMGTVQRNVTLVLVPLVPTAMAFTPNPVIGGQSISCRLVINGIAGPNGRTISIYDNSAYSIVPSSVTVPPGGTQVIFAVQTLPVEVSQYVTVTAAVTAGTKTGTFRINPAGG